MAVTATPVESTLQMQLQVGTDESGDPIIRTRSFSRVKPDAADADVFAVAKGLESLQEHLLVKVRRVNEIELTETV